jgi:adenylate cyclase
MLRLLYSLRLANVLALLGIAVSAGIFAVSPPVDLLRGLSLDVLVAIHWSIIGHGREPEASPVVVIALDEQTYRTPPFEGSPTIAWTGEIGRVLTSVIEAGARVVGFDIVFPVSIEQSAIPIGQDTLGARARGLDRDFLRALATAARIDKVVLGEMQIGDQPIVPAIGQRLAVGQRNIRALNVYSDDDEVVRRVPLTFTVDGKKTPSMSLELASRALGTIAEFGTDQSVTMAGYRVPAAIPDTLTVNFEGGARGIPTYSLADLRACLDKGDKDFFRRSFEGKVVLVGTNLDLEDRKLSSMRWATSRQPGVAARCVLPAPSTGLERQTIDGVFVHVAAVNNLLRRNALVELGRTTTGLIAIAMAAVVALVALVLAPPLAFLSFLGLALAWTATAAIGLDHALALPLLQPLFAGIIALAAAIAFRLIVSDKDKRFLRRSFALYLAPAVIERMLASNKPPALGGETRIVTVFFSDIAGFSTFSETMTPADLVALMNTYLSAMTDIIEEQGGFVDKYIGDAIVAVFGAPGDDPGHAANAVTAALRCEERLSELNRSKAAFKGQTLGQRIGLHSGEALLGNIGSRRRFNYTVIGDTVNLASRLEGANKYFGTSILASQATMMLAGTQFSWREIDAIRVKGRLQPVAVYEPLGDAGHETETQFATAYAEGLARWRARDFAAAVDCFARFSEVDRAAASFLERARSLVLEPPGPGWEPINTLEGK